jgi:hypothetical protein
MLEDWTSGSTARGLEYLFRIRRIGHRCYALPCTQPSDCIVVVVVGAIVVVVVVVIIIIIIIIIIIVGVY